MKSVLKKQWKLPLCRSPCGERGLKYRRNCIIACDCWSLPVRGAWIEMSSSACACSGSIASLPVRGAWIEIKGR